MVLIVTLEQKFRITISKILLYIGASSYSLYLTHSTLLFVGLKLLAAKYPEWTRVNVDSIMIALCLVSIFAAAACHELLEKPLIRLLKKPHRFFCD
jgi:peptidoglycan/LPS O-acetylase OafA/YrhL